MGWKNSVNRILHHYGYDIRQVPKGFTGLGRDPLGDMRRLTSAGVSPVVFDVGANVGQSVEEFRRYFSRPIIHSFEPTPETFGELQKRTTDVPDLYLNNVALGSRSGSGLLIERENSASVMNSFLESGSDTWGEVKGKHPVEVSTVDEYCRQTGIEHIDILKTDTQGFDLEVLRGGEEMMRKRAIELIFLEIIFSDMYKGQASLDEIYRFLSDRGFALISFYMIDYIHERARYTDALFIQPDYVMKSPRPAV